MGNALSLPNSTEKLACMRTCGTLKLRHSILFIVSPIAQDSDPKGHGNRDKMIHPSSVYSYADLAVHMATALVHNGSSTQCPPHQPVIPTDHPPPLLRNVHSLVRHVCGLPLTDHRYMEAQ